MARYFLILCLLFALPSCLFTKKITLKSANSVQLSEKARLRDTVIHAQPLASYDQLSGTPAASQDSVPDGEVVTPLSTITLPPAKRTQTPPSTKSQPKAKRSERDESKK